MQGTAIKPSNAKKLFQNSVDVERSWNTLEALGLRAKLIALPAENKMAADSLATMMSREPLRSHEIGLGHGKTAAELGISRVAHETKQPLALESLTRSKRGWVNAFISRAGKTGENAVHGDGFYTKIGNEGAVGSGLTIRFRVDPRARVGTDFLFPKDSPDYVIVLNKRALLVIPESLDAPL
jgi:hypothetical protein